MKIASLKFYPADEYNYSGDIAVSGSTFIWPDLSVDPSSYHYVKYGGSYYRILAGHPGNAGTDCIIHSSQVHNSLSMGYQKNSGYNPWNWSSSLPITSIARDPADGGTIFTFSKEPRNNKRQVLTLMNEVLPVTIFTPPFILPYIVYWYGDGVVTTISSSIINSDGSVSILFSSSVDPFASFVGVEVDKVDWSEKRLDIWPGETGSLNIKGLFDSSGNPIADTDVLFHKSSVSIEEFAVGDDKYQIKKRFKNTLEDYVNTRLAQWAQQNLR